MEERDVARPSLELHPTRPPVDSPDLRGGGVSAGALLAGDLDSAREQVREQPAEDAAPAVQRLRRKGRPQKATARFTSSEWVAVVASAKRAGLTPSGWVAASIAALGQQKPPPRVRVDEATLQEVAETRKQLVRIGTLLNQSVAALHSTGEVPPGLPYLAGRVDMLLSELDRLTMALVGRRGG